MAPMSGRSGFRTLIKEGSDNWLADLQRYAWKLISRYALEIAQIEFAACRCPKPRRTNKQHYCNGDPPMHGLSALSRNPIACLATSERQRRGCSSLAAPVWAKRCLHWPWGRYRQWRGFLTLAIIAAGSRALSRRGNARRIDQAPHTRCPTAIE